MKKISSITEISLSYRYFIFDVWGVIHDGSSAYPGVLEVLQFLKKNGKNICFLSNAPRRARKVAEVLRRYGITEEIYDFILTSGEAFYLDLKHNWQNFEKKYFYIGPEKDLDLLDGLDFERVDEVRLADFVVTTGFDHDDSTLAEKMPQALEAVRHNLPMFCANPDLIVVKKDGKEMICAGALAKEYERLGGKVIYYGKPFSQVYKMTCEFFKTSDNSKVIAIGDGLETDIKGARDYGIDSVLVTGGILTNELGHNHERDADISRLEAVCNRYGIHPQFVISNLKL